MRCSSDFAAVQHGPKYREPERHCKPFLLRCSNLEQAASRRRSAIARRCRPSTPTSFVLPLPPGHRFPMAKYRLLRERVRPSCPASQLRRGAAGQRRRTGAGAHAGLRRRGRRRAAVAPPQQREIGFPWSPAHGRARAPLGRRDDRRRAQRAARRRRGQPGRRHAPRLRRQGRRLLRLQRRRRRRAADAGRVAPRAAPAAARGGHRPRRAPGQRHRGDLPRRPDRVHAVAARREELPVPQGGERPRRRPARRLRRRRLPRRRSTRALAAAVAAARRRDRPAWSSTWPAPTRTRTTGSAG